MRKLLAILGLVGSTLALGLLTVPVSSIVLVLAFLGVIPNLFR